MHHIPLSLRRLHQIGGKKGSSRRAGQCRTEAAPTRQGAGAGRFRCAHSAPGLSVPRISLCFLSSPGPSHIPLCFLSSPGPSHIPLCFLSSPSISAAPPPPDDFDAPTLHLDYQSLRVPMDERHISLTQRPGWLRMYGRSGLASRFAPTLNASPRNP